MSRTRKQSEDRSWRGIDQNVSTRAMTGHGRRRLRRNLLRVLAISMLIGAAGAGGIHLWRDLGTPAESLAPVANGEPVRDVVVLTDGVLTQQWVLDRLALPDRILLMAVDLDAAKRALESEGQVRAAVVKRDFPDTLVVTIAERAPVVRIMVPLEPGDPVAMLVGRDGFVYRGHHYDPPMIASLPWLDGIRLVRAGDGFTPVEGVDRVSELLLHTRQDAPHIASEFRVVSLEQLPLIIVRTRSADEILFEAGNYRRQLARLDFILDHYRDVAGPDVRFKRIDVSVNAQVAVELAAPFGAPVAGPAELSLFTQNLTNQ